MGRFLDEISLFLCRNLCGKKKGGVSHARTGYGFRAQGRWRAERKKAA